MDISKYKPASKNILKQDKKKTSPGLAKQIGIRFTLEEREKLHAIADREGVDKLGTTVKMLLRRGGHI